MKKRQQVTHAINNCRDSTLFMGCSPHQVLNGLIGNRPQSATIHSAIRWRALQETDLQVNG